MKGNSLNDLHSQYINGKITCDEFEGAMYSYFLYNQDKTCLSHWNHDEYEDYISWFYQRFKKIIDSYRDIGSSFEAFAGKYLLVSSKEYRVRITTDNITEYSAWSARVSEMYAHEETPGYFQENKNNVFLKLINGQKGRKSSRRILTLILKCYNYVSDDFIDKIAPMIGIDRNELARLITDIQKIRQKKDDAIYNLKERIYCLYYRCVVYEKRMSFIHENTASWEKLNSKLNNARKRLDNLRGRLKLIRTEATNSQVAEVIGVKKGTVDASLFILKARLKSLTDKSILN
jgi:hypothetical protein